MTMIWGVVESPNGLVTERLQIRRPTEADRPRIVELFGNQDFMVFSHGVMTEAEANRRFDHMVARCSELSFAKQPIVERSSGVLIGYTGVDWIELEDGRWLEWGYRLSPRARGQGYATEASGALLKLAATEYTGQILGIIHPENEPSKKVIRKLGFGYWKRTPIDPTSEVSRATI